jgi:hypothetical protein
MSLIDYMGLFFAFIVSGFIAFKSIVALVKAVKTGIAEYRFLRWSLEFGMGSISICDGT